jgi:branched-chain amino acid transport system permease protein
VAKASTVIVFVLIILAFLLPIVIGEWTYVMHILIIILIFATFGQTWNMLAGFAGQLSLGQHLFFGIGAYTFALIIYYVDWFKTNPWPALFLGGLLSMLIGLPIGIICFRLRGAYFALSTLAASEVMRLIILNAQFTFAGQGVVIPSPPTVQLGIFTIDFRSKIPYYYIALIIMLAVFYLVNLINRSRIGFKLLTIREDEDTAATLGISPFKMKVFALIVSTSLAGITGALYAQYISYIDALTDPGGVLAPWTGLDAILISLIGGIGTVLGPIFGAIIRMGLGELLRVIFGWATGIDLLTFGLLLMFIVLFLRKGIWGFVKERMQARRRAKVGIT